MGEALPTVIMAARLVTAVDGEVIQDAAIAVDGGRITHVGTSVDVKHQLGRNHNTLDYGSSTILPGLIDAHCHITLTGDGSTYEQQVLDPDEMMSLIAVNNMERHLAAGVTTIRDNGGRNRVVFVVREAVRRGYIRAPRMLLSGRPLTHSYGHFYWCNGVADGPVEIKAAVRQLVAEGADHIKIMASGGATAGNIPYYASYDAEEMRVAVDAAHALGRLTTAHCRATTSMENAVEAGLDCIEHAEFLVPGQMMEIGRGVASSGVMQYDPRVTERILRSGLYVSFTAQAGGLETLQHLRVMESQRTLTADERHRKSALEGYFDIKLGILSALVAEGMLPRLAISSDAGPFDASFGRLQDGIELSVAAGLSPVQAIISATATPAAACGIADQVGSLKPGLLADLLVVAGDATQDVSRLWDVTAVYQSGQLVAPLSVVSPVDTRRLDLNPTPRAQSMPDC